jgi:hypothetical protein
MELSQSIPELPNHIIEYILDLAELSLLIRLELLTSTKLKITPSSIERLIPNELSRDLYYLYKTRHNIMELNRVDYCDWDYGISFRYDNINKQLTYIYTRFVYIDNLYERYSGYEGEYIEVESSRIECDAHTGVILNKK